MGTFVPDEVGAFPIMAWVSCPAITLVLPKVYGPDIRISEATCEVSNPLTSAVRDVSLVGNESHLFGVLGRLCRREAHDLLQGRSFPST